MQSLPMLTTYFTYRALAREWDDHFRGDRLLEAHSGRKNELSVVTTAGAIIFGMRGSFRYLFYSDRYAKPRRNVAPVMESVRGATVSSVRIADRDRLLYVDLDNGHQLIYVLYGSSPNVLVVAGDRVVDAFKSAGRLRGSPAPTPRPAPRPADAGAFADALADKTIGLQKAIRRAVPLFDILMAREVAHRVGLDREADIASRPDAVDRLFQSAQTLEAEALDSPAGRIYWDGEWPEAMSLVELTHLQDNREEFLDSADSAVRVYCRRMLARERFSAELEPIRRRIAAAADRATRREAELTTRLAEPSRADLYERWGHLLMSSGRLQESAADQITVPDHFESGEAVRIPLDPDLTVVENAERYYRRAKNTRVSRESATRRLEHARREAAQLRMARREIDRVDSPEELDEFRARYRGLLPQASRGGEVQVPFRRFVLGSNCEVWVGRNARENEELTFKAARKFDIWMHARGVPGSHVVLRLPGRDSKPDSATLETAASIAAYYSKARGSEFAPVLYTEKKFVRRARAAPHGTVIAEKEKVLIVPPRLPTATPAREIRSDHSSSDTQNKNAIR